MVANALARRAGKATTARVVAGVASLFILAAYYVGMHAVKTGS
jgi:hypothetical protein